MASSSSAPPKKKQKSTAERLVDLHHGSYVSQSALTCVLKDIREKGLPNAVSRRAQYRSYADLNDRRSTPYGPVVQDFVLDQKSGQPKTIAVQHPGAMLYAALQVCPPLRRFVVELLRRTANSMRKPWRIIFYFDGITPSDALSKKVDKRGVQAVYWSFLEFGHFLYHEELWFEVAAARNTFTETGMAAGMSHFIRLTHEKLFFSAEDMNMRTHGATIDLSEAADDSETRQLWCDHYKTIADLKALVQYLFAKGFHGTKPCPICRTLVDHKTNYATADVDGNLKPLTDLSWREWKRHTDDSIQRLMVKFAALQTQIDNEVVQTEAKRLRNEMEDDEQRMGYKLSLIHI